ncbi:hypothetical protein ABZ746_09295 [Streptomyces sp. NPDC020096]
MRLSHIATAALAGTTVLAVSAPLASAHCHAQLRSAAPASTAAAFAPAAPAALRYVQAAAPAVHGKPHTRAATAVAISGDDDDSEYRRHHRHHGHHHWRHGHRRHHRHHGHHGHHGQWLKGWHDRHGEGVELAERGQGSKPIAVTVIVFNGSSSASNASNDNRATVNSQGGSIQIRKVESKRRESAHHRHHKARRHHHHHRDVS